MKSLGSYFQKKLESLTVKYGETLFPLEWGNLRENRCPICSCRLRLTTKGLYLCSSKKHIKPFVLKKAQFNEIVEKLVKNNSYTHHAITKKIDN